MAILQVNVKRNSDGRDSNSSQRREQARRSNHTAEQQDPRVLSDAADNNLQDRQTTIQTQTLGNGGKAAHTSQNPLSKAQNTDIWQQVVWRLSPGTPIGRAIISATQRLEDAGSPSAHLDAQVILAHIMGQDRGWLFAHYDQTLDDEQAASLTEMVARRAADEPVAYLIGRKEFYGLELAVDHRVLIPRPETELLVDAVLDHIDSRADKRVTVVDVGTGSGAIALAVAHNAPDAIVYALDISEDALKVAHRNVVAHRKKHQVQVLPSDLMMKLDRPVDVVAANLPYITSSCMTELDAGIREYEPHLALEGGNDGLAVIRALLCQIPDRLNPGGVIFLEIGSDQGQAAVDLVHEILPQATYVGLRQDYHGLDRLVVIGT